MTEEVKEEQKPAKVDYEAEALSKGWKKKEDFVGDPDDWAPAKAWLKTGDILDTVHSLKRQFKTQQEVVDHLVDQNKKIAELTRSKTIAELRAQQISAAEIGDTAKVSNITEEIIKVTASPVNVPPITELPAAVKNFTETHASWWKGRTADDIAMQEYAKAKVTEIERDNPALDTDAVFNALDKDIRKKFAYKFIREDRHGAVESPRSKDIQSTSESRLSDLDPYYQSLYKSIKRSSKDITEAQYIKQLRESGAI